VLVFAVLAFAGPAGAEVQPWAASIIATPSATPAANRFPYATDWEDTGYLAVSRAWIR